jgi:DNA-binding GntR family transcriptional regulator
VRNLYEEHQAITRAVVGGDADQAVALLTAHFQASANVILADPAVFTRGQFAESGQNL